MKEKHCSLRNACNERFDLWWFVLFEFGLVVNPSRKITLSISSATFRETAEYFCLFSNTRFLKIFSGETKQRIIKSFFNLKKFHDTVLLIKTADFSYFRSLKFHCIWKKAWESYEKGFINLQEDFENYQSFSFIGSRK